MKLIETGKWILTNLDELKQEIFVLYNDAFDRAAEIVGNRSVTRPSRCLTLFGPSDENTTVIIRPELVLREEQDIEEKEKCNGSS